MIEAYNPAFGSDVDPESPAELVPKSGEFGIEQHQYSTVVMFQGPFEAPAKNLGGVLFDITAEPQAGFDHLRYGARLTYSHVWRPVGGREGPPAAQPAARPGREHEHRRDRLDEQVVRGHPAVALGVGAAEQQQRPCAHRLADREQRRERVHQRVVGDVHGVDVRRGRVWAGSPGSSSGRRPGR